MNTDVARAAVDAARCPLGDQSGFGRCDGATSGEVKGIVGRPVAGKTGTTDGDKTAALMAMTKQLAIAGILGDPDDPLTNKLAGAFGGDPHKVVNKAVEYTLRDAMAGVPAVNFTPPSRDIAFGKRSGVPDVRCQTVEAAQAALKGAGFTTTVSDTPVASDCPPGTVAKTDPSGDSVRGGIIVLYISKGPGNPVPDPGGGGGGIDPGGGHNGRKCKLFPWLCQPGGRF